MKESSSQIGELLLARSIVESIREPILVLDGNFEILFASGSFHRSFKLDPNDTRNQSLFALDGGTWDIPALRQLLERTISERATIEGFKITHDFPRVGRRILLLHARQASCEDDRRTIVLGLEDVTERRAIERDKAQLQTQTDDLLRQKELLLAEMEHRIINSLQIIASILMLKARAVTSEETRQHLQDAHRRVMSVAAVQQYLHSSSRADRIEIAPYLSKLCGSLAESVGSENRPATLKVLADAGSLVSTQAVSLGLIVTELVINALKHAFPKPSESDAVTVRYEVNGTDWKLSVTDNGAGRTSGSETNVKGGLGTSLVKALAHQLDAQIETTSGLGGMSVSITHATFTSRYAQVA